MLRNNCHYRQKDAYLSFYTFINIIGMFIIPFMTFAGKLSIITYHLAMEIILIGISVGILIVTSNTWNISKNEWYKYFGTCFSVLCFFVMLHVVFYSEKYAVSGDPNDLSYVFDLYESTIRAFAITIFVHFSHKGLEAKRYFKIFMLIPVILVVFVIINRVPSIFIRGNNPYNSIGQALIILLCFMNLIILYLRRKAIKRDAVFHLVISTVLAILTELMVVLNIEHNNISMIISHYCKVLSVFLMYKLIVNHILRQPIQYLNESLLKKNSELAESVKKLNVQNEKLDAMRRDLSEKEKSYRAIIENLPIALVIRQGEKIIFSNATAVKLFKRKEGQNLIGASFFNYIHPDYLETAKKNYEESNKDKMIISSEGKLINHEGETIDAEITIIPVVFNKEKAHLILIRNLAEVKRSEAMKIELQLARENERLCTEFFANLSHELRTPLNIIYTSCQIIEMYIEQNSIDKISEYIRLLKQNCYRMTKLVNNIIDSSRISEGFYLISCSMVDFVRVIEDTVLSLVPFLEKNNVELIFDTDVEEKFMLVDEDKIERIVLNLLSNAVKYRSDKNSLIEVKITDGEKEITVSVKDNGIGISKEKQSIIFNRFNKVDRSLNRGEEGSGLGLYIVKSLVELHNGTIELISEENIGSEFIIKLPVITTEKPEEGNKIIKTESMNEKIQVEFSDIYDFEVEN